MPTNQPKSISKVKPKPQSKSKTAVGASWAMKQTRARSQLNNAPPLMEGLDPQNRPLNPLTPDPERLAYIEVVEKLKDGKKKKKKIIFVKSQARSPPSPTPNPKQQSDSGPVQAQPASSSSPPRSSPHQHSAPMTSHLTGSGSGDDGGSSDGSSNPEDGEDSSGPGGTSLGRSDAEFNSGGSSGYDTSSERGSNPPDPSGSSHHSRHSRSSSDSNSPGGAPLNGSLYHNSSDSDSPGGVPVNGSPGQNDANDDSQTLRGTSIPGSPGAGSDTSSTIDHLIMPASNFAVNGFSRPQASSSREARPADVMIPRVDTSGIVAHGNHLTNQSPFENIAATQVSDLPNSMPSQGEERMQALAEVAHLALLRTAFPSCSGGSLSKRRRSDSDQDDGDSPEVETKKRRLSNSDAVPGTCTHTSVNLVATEEPQVAKFQGLDQSQGLNSNENSPLALPDFDPEIPDLYGSGLRARPHYDWYEQYHPVGYECAIVHRCDHNPGRHCHECHAAWQRAWSRYCKAQELLLEAVEDPEKYLEETGIDLRQGYMGALMQGSGWEVLAPELQPPAGGKVRIHPARIARHKLALAKLAS
ncbi:hypothetical protein F66182_5667 [Fusarium sp. NRRL 66182]|nr:hypothetical protein F66182_5667 [Fusarium sp. NRRL 66182]